MACSKNWEECLWDIDGKAEGKRPLGRPVLRQMNIIKTDHRAKG
jgi:hypothetical protein